MSNEDEHGRPKGQISSEDRDAIKKRASELGDRLDAVKGRKPAVSQSGYKAQGEGLSLAFRFMIELLVGVCVGLAIGWFLDKQFGTQPWLLIVFLLLGFVAGMVNMIRAAQKEQTKHPVPANAKPVADDEDDGKN